MDNKRAILAVGLSLLVLIAWTYLYAPEKKTPPPVETTGQEAPVEKKAEKPAPGTGSPEVKISTPQGAEEKKAEKPSPTQTPVESARIIEVQTRLAIYKISEVGGRIISVQLKGMTETSDKNSGLKELVKISPEIGTLELTTHGNSIKGLDQAVFSAQTQGLKVNAQETEKSVVFKWVSQEGVEVLKTFTFRPGSYLFGLRAEINNHTGQEMDDNFGVLLNAKHEPKEGGNYAFKGFGAYVDEHLTEKDIGDLKKEERIVTGKVSWGGYENSYFLQAVIPDKEQASNKNGRIKASLAPGQEESKTPDVKVTYLTAPVRVPAGQRLSLDFLVFFGPKKIALLNKAGYDLAKSINMGWFDIIAKPFLYFLNYTYDFLGNFGLAIIVLTIVVKLVFWPLTQKSYKSMKGMQALQPKMAALRDKYKGDKQRLNQEMMGLYKAHGVNPMGGCLPMVIQIPVFIALYRLLDYAIELRHEPFYLWIQDLSAPDRLFRFPFSVPFMEPPFGIPVLTLLMGASMFITQKMTPTPGDPTQAKIMLLMPIVFTFIFINFPSGLVLYWLTQNVLSIGQQYWVNKKK